MKKRRRRDAVSRHISHDFGKESNMESSESENVKYSEKKAKEAKVMMEERQSKTLKNFKSKSPVEMKMEEKSAEYSPIININQIKYNNVNSGSNVKPVVSPLDLPLNHEKKTISRTVSMKQSKISGNPIDGVNAVRRTKTKIIDKNDFISDFSDRKKNTYYNISDSTDITNNTETNLKVFF